MPRKKETAVFHLVIRLVFLTYLGSEESESQGLTTHDQEGREGPVPECHGACDETRWRIIEQGRKGNTAGRMGWKGEDEGNGWRDER
jgi:hypothetical protein